MFAKMMMAAALAVSATAAGAETIEIKMLNRGEAGAMVFEPAFVKAETGDVIRFVPTDKGHNAESIDGMLPDGVEAFKSKMNKEFELTATEEGVYGIKCTPHYAMGMVAVVQVGDPVNLDAAAAVKQRGKSKDPASLGRSTDPGRCRAHRPIVFRSGGIPCPNKSVTAARRCCPTASGPSSCHPRFSRLLRSRPGC
jgi:pseudoazurin